jgi:hypothetical protein
MKLETIRCQCPDIGFNHGANGCRGIAVYAVIRAGRYIKVCGDCILTRDEDLTPTDRDGNRKPLRRLSNGNV